MSEVSLNTILVAGALDAFHQALNIWDDCVPYWVFYWGSGCLAVTTGCICVLWCVTNMGIAIILWVAIC